MLKLVNDQWQNCSMCKCLPTDADRTLSLINIHADDEWRMTSPCGSQCSMCMCVMVSYSGFMYRV